VNSEMKHDHATCPRCLGGGHITTDEFCPECAGQPFVSLDGHTIVCEHCYGTGRVNVPCPDCSGHRH
jgi:DnaJ-class molecular chaperone